MHLQIFNHYFSFYLPIYFQTVIVSLKNVSPRKAYIL